MEATAQTALNSRSLTQKTIDSKHMLFVHDTYFFLHL